LVTSSNMSIVVPSDFSMGIHIGHRGVQKRGQQADPYHLVLYGNCWGDPAREEAEFKDVFEKQYGLNIKDSSVYLDMHTKGTIDKINEFLDVLHKGGEPRVMHLDTRS